MRIRHIFLILVIALLLTSCGGNEQGMYSTPYSPRQIAEIIIASQADISPMHPLTMEDDFFWDHLSGRYQIDIGEIGIADGVVFYAGGVIVDEIAVLLLSEESDVPAVRDLLSEYVDRRRIAFSGYAPIQAALLGDSIVSVQGNHVALLISENPKGAEATFLACFSATPPGLPPESTLLHTEPPEGIDAPGGTVPREGAGAPEGVHTPEGISAPEGPGATEGIGAPEGINVPEETAPQGEAGSQESAAPPEETGQPRETVEVVHGDAYDPASILRAWTTGDTSGLSQKNRRIHDKCASIINLIIREGMDDFDKQLAVHNWIIEWGVYDPEFLSIAPDAAPNPNSDNPYGLLFGQVGICTGFTFTFQLFMDLLGIECITVLGYDFSGGKHGWNLVRIGGKWYAVDVTLDVTLNNPLGSEPTHVPDHITHRHFNVTSQFLWDLGHRWDRDSVPEAT